MPEAAATCLDPHRTGMAWSVLHEALRLLRALATSGDTGAIDLRSLPLTAADRDELEALLGRGEVNAELALAGRTEVRETAFAGVWWVRHYGGGERLAAELISVCPVPDILFAHPEDVKDGARRLGRLLAERTPVENPE